MSGYDIYKKALIRLGLQKFDELNLSEELKETMLTGVLMLLSLNIGDTIQNKLYTDLYNAKRAKYLSSNDTVKDVLPTAKECV